MNTQADIKPAVTIDEAFLSRWHNSPRIAFDPHWMTTKDYPLHATASPSAPQIPLGGIVSSITDDGRRMLLTGTVLGNVVLMERYQDDPGFLIWAASSAIRTLVGEKVANALTFHSYNVLIGEGVTSAISKLCDFQGESIKEFYLSKHYKFKRELPPRQVLKAA